MYLFFNPNPFLLLISILLVSVFITSKWVSTIYTPKKNLPPSPPGLPIIGNLHQLGFYPYRSLRALSEKYGDLMLLHLGSKPTIVVSSAEIASLVLKRHDLIFASRPHLSIFRRLLANGNDIVSSPYGEHWRLMRSICAVELLSSNKVRSYEKARIEEVVLMTKKIQTLELVNLSELFRSHSRDLICIVAFGRRYRGNEGGIDFTKLLNEFVEILGGYFIGDFISWLGWISKINGVDGKLSRVTRTFDNFLEKVLHEHEEHSSERYGEQGENGNAVKDFVDVLLEVETGDGKLKLDKVGIKALTLDIFAAATEATYIALEWVMSELLSNTRVMEELQKEVKKHIGDKIIVTEDGVQNMKYLKAVFKETLRLHTPGPFLIPHECAKDITINGYDISAGTQVIINAWSICRDPRYWDEPERFHPERFLDSPVDFKGHDFQFILFGSGRRMCPGMTFATASVELVIANLAHQFHWSLPKGACIESLDMKEAPGLVMHKKNLLLAVASPRINTLDYDEI